MLDNYCQHNGHPYAEPMILGALKQSKRAWIYVLIILATITATYVPVVAFDYGYADDYWVLTMRPINYENLSISAEKNNTDGRPLFTIWQPGVFWLCNGVQDLKFVRLLSLFGIFFASLVFYKMIRRHLVEDPIDASLIAAIFAINPSFLIVAAWAANGSISYGCLLGLLSSYVLLRDARSDGDPGSLSWTDRPWRRFGLSALFLFAATFLYQPIAMLFWLGIAIWVVGRFTATRDDWMKLVKMTALFFSVIVAYFLFCHVVWPPSGRFHLSFSIIRRAGWFVLFPLRSTLSYPFIQPVDAWGIAALYIISLGLWSYCRQTSRTMWIPLLILMMTPLTVLPTIVAYVHYDVSRTRGALYGIIIILWCVTFEAIVRRYGKGGLKLRHILIPILVLLIISGRHNLQRNFIMPQVCEEAALQSKLEEYVRENPNLGRAIAIWPPPNNMTEIQGVDEMGFASLSRPAAPLFEIPVFLASIAHCKIEDLPSLKIITLHGDEIPPQDAFVIDFRQLRIP